MKRSLKLRREVLTDLNGSDLRAVGGGTTKVVDDLLYGSRLDYISCWWWQCIVRDSLRECVDTDVRTTTS